jgi:protocatechuate 3,4-dioxygenase alpha subunit
MPVQLLPQTPSQTAGPYVHIGLALEAAGNPPRAQEIGNQMAKPGAPGEHIVLLGYVYDGNGQPIRDAFLEFWQANADGVYDSAYALDKPFNGFGRTATTEDGEWTIHTVKPGTLHNAPGSVMAAHINVALFARGINIHLQSRLYFEDEPEANALDPVLNLIEQPHRRESLMARRCTVDGKLAYRFDIHVQGDAETVFFDF